MPNIKICFSEVQTLEQSHQICKNSKFDFWITSLAHVKYQVKIIFGRKIFIYEPIFKNFVALFTTLECKRTTIPYLYVGVLEQGYMQKLKVVSKGWCKESTMHIYHTRPF